MIHPILILGGIALTFWARVKYERSQYLATGFEQYNRPAWQTNAETAVLLTVLIGGSILLGL